MPSRQFLIQQATLSALAAEFPATVCLRGASGAAQWILDHTTIADPIWSDPRQHFFGRQVCRQFRALAAQHRIRVAA